MNVITGQQLRALIAKRAQIVVAQKCAGKVDRSCQTYVTRTGKQRRQGCANCFSRDGHEFTECEQPYRRGFRHTCGAEGVDEEDCVYPHGIAHEMTLNQYRTLTQSKKTIKAPLQTNQPIEEVDTEHMGDKPP
uniref:Uncharacterized protein n=1 Tax=Bracon brevicornis TaxID=1563983 RepID=A0A6V7LZG0_9HYME